MFLQNQINAEMPMLGGYDEAGLNDFQRRMIRHEELAKKFQARIPALPAKTKRPTTPRSPTSTAIAGNGFTAGDLKAAKAKLEIK